MIDVKEAEMALAGIHNPVPWQQVHLSGRLRDIWYLIRQEGAAESGWSRSIWRKRKWKWKNHSQAAAVHVLSDPHITSSDFHPHQAAGRAARASGWSW